MAILSPISSPHLSFLFPLFFHHFLLLFLFTTPVIPPLFTVFSPFSSLFSFFILSHRFLYVSFPPTTTSDSLLLIFLTLLFISAYNDSINSLKSNPSPAHSSPHHSALKEKKSDSEVKKRPPGSAGRTPGGKAGRQKASSYF
jgi:hypothetical protein